MFSRPKILFLVSLLFVAQLNSIPTYLLNFEFFYNSFQLISVDINFITHLLYLYTMEYWWRLVDHGTASYCLSYLMMFLVYHKIAASDVTRLRLMVGPHQLRVLGVMAGGESDCA